MKLDADVLYVEDGSLLTSAGTTAGIDCCLHLLRLQPKPLKKKTPTAWVRCGRRATLWPRALC